MIALHLLMCLLPVVTPVYESHTAHVPTQVNYTADCRSVWVTTKASAPGGARTEKVGLPWDPELYDHMLTHGVFIDAVQVR